jgi:alpha-glucosidase
VLFSTASHPIIFEPQYLRAKTTLPPDANIYGLGEHTESFRLPTHNLTRTLWSRDAFGVPPGTNLYGNHPVYFEHRKTGTHGVFLLNSNGMDVKIDDVPGGTTLEYNVIGGVLDFYFLAGSESDPVEVARQYAEVVGKPAEVPYWSFGFHQCRFGYNSAYFLPFVIVLLIIFPVGRLCGCCQCDHQLLIGGHSSRDNVDRHRCVLLSSDAHDTKVMLLDYMYRRRVFTVDQQYFPLPKMREIVDYLHSHSQKYGQYCLHSVQLFRHSIGLSW